MPRSLHASLREVVGNLDMVKNEQSAETQRRAGKLLADLQYARVDEILATGLHAYLTQFLDRVNELGWRISQDSWCLGVDSIPPKLADRFCLGHRGLAAVMKRRLLYYRPFSVNASSQGGPPMRQLSTVGQQVINDIAQRHGFSVDATLSMLESVINGNGSMAQFSHPEFAGSGQWMRGGMTMVSDMFNNHLKGRVDSLCFELSNVIASQPDLVRSGSFQSQRQGGGYSNGQAQASYGGGQQQSGYTSNFGPSSLFVPPAPGTSGDWWPSDLRWPNSTGAQNGVRYAYFAQACRLAIEVNGRVTVYDTLDHNIGGFSQQQSYGGTLGFNSQYGLIDVASLPVISVDGVEPFVPKYVAAEQPMQNFDINNGSAPSGNQQDVFATIEKLADLRAKGILSDDEFLSKKAELLSRV